MITTTCEPLNARRSFNSRTPVNWVIALVTFLILIYGLQFLLPIEVPYLLIVVATIGINFVFFFYVLQKRAIGIVCPNPKCGKYIETNTPWKCGNPNCEKKINEQVDDFPIVYRCQHCGVEPKAFECPHCREPIYLGKDRLKTIYATFVNIQEPVRPKRVKKDKVAEKVVKQHEEKRDLIHELEVTQLKGNLMEAKSKIEPPAKKKTPYEELEEYMQTTDGNEDAERKWRAAIDKEFKNNPDARMRKHLRVDQWMKNRVE